MNNVPAAYQEDLDRMIALLRGRGWATARDVCRRMGWIDTDNNLRMVRTLAQKSDGRIASGPSSPGYILTEELKPADWHHIESIRNQAEEMTARYIAISRAWHSRQTQPSPVAATQETLL